jgi:CMP-N-acetylneuraminic acid synthetase
MHSNGYGYVIDNKNVVDIDTIEDWKRAELISRIMKNEAI